ncbi:restriction endonuclease-like protein [uncultured Bacteroides sp.]|uniref:restriction endonuclease-like protein n=1 Tax=uncultured Bacteroides sp. TaxID=162156 RepID=UPI00262E1F9A|nr:restriction endonuclease-like protein [uncultured Bacteroides sp.]
MEALLKLEHKDFELLVSCNSYDRTFKKAAACMRVGADAEALQSYYIWSDKSAVLTCRGNTVVQGTHVPSAFFENTDYQYWIRFKTAVRTAYIDTPLRAVSEGFCFNEDAQVLYGHINYGNDIGRTDLKISYRPEGGEKQSFVFSYDVLSTKLDYHNDLKHIIRDIEQEYRMLSIDFFRRTHHSFAEKQQGETPDIIWWNVFREVNEEFIQAVKAVVDRPRHKISRKETYCRADKLKRLNPKLESELAEHRAETHRLYRTEVPDMSADTFENRFLKYAVKTVAMKFMELKARIVENYPMDSSIRFIETLTDTEEELKRLMNHSFFRMVGNFKGMNQESLALKQGTGYSQIYRIWLLLTCSYDLEEGIRSLELKDIATLYEIWCFIEVKNLVRSLLGENNLDVDNQSRVELNRHFTYSLTKGQTSKVVFSRMTSEGEKVELAEVIYNPKEDRKSDTNETSIEHTYSFTVPQKPDIVLQLTRRDIDTGFRLTYLFDAKYRIEKPQAEGADTPPDDAINQMHRYRDALYYDPRQEGLPIKKEVLGGYILFPGNGTDDEVAQADFYRSIEKVNIGAFPLRPNNKNSSCLLRNFLQSLIWEQPTLQILQDVKAQKGTTLTLEKSGTILAVTIFENGQREYYQQFMDREKEIEYYFGKITLSNQLSKLNFQKYDYFVPVIKGKIRDIYLIEHSSIRYRKELPRLNNRPIADDDVRIVLKLVKPSYLVGSKQFVSLHPNLFPPRRWGFREFVSVRELLGYAAAE